MGPRRSRERVTLPCAVAVAAVATHTLSRLCVFSIVPRVCDARTKSGTVWRCATASFGASSICTRTRRCAKHTMCSARRVMLTCTSKSVSSCGTIALLALRPCRLGGTCCLVGSMISLQFLRVFPHSVTDPILNKIPSQRRSGRAKGHKRHRVLQVRVGQRCGREEH